MAMDKSQKIGIVRISRHWLARCQVSGQWAYLCGGTAACLGLGGTGADGPTVCATGYYRMEKVRDMAGFKLAR